MLEKALKDGQEAVNLTWQIQSEHRGLLKVILGLTAFIIILELMGVFL